MQMNPIISRDRRSPSGFSLIELMIVMAIGSLLILGLAQISSYQARVAKTGELDKQLDDIKRQFQSWIFNQAYCDASFSGLRNGDVPDGIRRSNGVNDFIVRTGDRLPGSDWAIESFTLLSRAEIIQLYPQYGAGVNADGIGTGILRVALHQLRRGTVNTQVAAGEDTGAYKSIRKELFFPINAKFGNPMPVTAVGYPPEEAFKFRSDTGPGQGGMCCPLCLVPGSTTETYLARARSELPTVSPSPAPGPAPNPLYMKSEADYPTTAPSPYLSPLPGGFTTDVYTFACYLYNLDYAIITCASPDQGTL